MLDLAVLSDVLPNHFYKAITQINFTFCSRVVMIIFVILIFTRTHIRTFFLFAV